MGPLSQPQDPPGTGPSAPPQRVLLVEDDPEAALFAVYALGKHGRFEVTHTADPAAALALAAAGPWDLALTDLDLPVMSGLDLIAGLRAIAPRLPVILLTAHSAAELRIAPGCRPDGLLVKPVSAEALLAAAEAVVEARAGRRR